MSLRILRLSDVIKKTGIPKSSLYSKIAKGEFPKPINLSVRSVGWLEEEIHDWILSRISKGDSNE